MKVLRNLTIGTRLGAGFGVLVLALVAICVLAVAGTVSIVSPAERIGGESWQRARAAHELEDALLRSYAAVLQGLQRPDQGLLAVQHERLKQDRVAMTGALAELSGLVGPDAERAALSRIEGELKSYLGALAQFSEHAESGRTAQAEAAIHQQLGPRFSSVADSLRRFAQGSETQARQSVDARLEPIATARNAMIALGGLAAAAGIAFAWVVTRSLTVPLGEALSAARRIAAGRLDQPIEARGRDEVAQLLQALSDMQQELRGTISQVVHGAGDLTASASRFSAMALGGMTRVQSHTETTAATAAAVEEMTASIGQVAEHAQEAAGIAGRSSELASEGESIVRAASSEMKSIADSVQHGSRLVETLNKRSAQISSIVKVIKDIADQTNLLALNAAIEAARAGEQGRGFAVVADEVRKLAERTGTATSEIGGMIDAIQQETSTVVETMQAGGDKVVQGVKLADDAAAALEKIKAQALEAVESVNAIAAATREQQAASSDIARNVERIAQMTEENGRAAGEGADSARLLENLAANLQSRVERFTV